MTGDLSSMTAPPFILSPVSLTEFPGEFRPRLKNCRIPIWLHLTNSQSFTAYWGERPELFADIATGRTEQERAEKVLRWFICTLKGQYTVSRDPFRVTSRLSMSGW